MHLHALVHIDTLTYTLTHSHTHTLTHTLTHTHTHSHTLTHTFNHLFYSHRRENGVSMHQNAQKNAMHPNIIVDLISYSCSIIIMNITGCVIAAMQCVEGNPYSAP